MINNLFVLNSTGDVLIEKHFVGQTKRYVCDLFWEEVQKHDEQTSVPPVIVTPNYYLLHVRRNGMFFLTASNQEDPPLLCIELLHRAVDVLLHYFRGDGETGALSLKSKGKLNDQTVRENFTLVYHLLDEMVDGGFPSTTDFNQLVELIAPSGLADMSKKMFMQNYSKFKAVLPGSVTSKTPWRRTNVKYVSNEIKLDIVERVDAIFGANDRLVTSEIHGVVEVNCRLSGTPELVLRFTNAHMLNNNVKLHRCVHIKKFKAENVIMFVPPDGKFSMLEFSLPNNTNVPLHVRPQIDLNGGQGQGKVTVTLSQRGKNIKQMENVLITIPFPKETSSFSLTANCGKIIPDEITKVVLWSIAKYPRDKQPQLDGTVSLPQDFKHEARQSIKADFFIKQYSVSGLKVETLVVNKVNYKPFKGVRSNTRAGSYRIRT